MRKTVALVLSLILMLSCTACSEKSNSIAESSSNQLSNAAPPTAQSPSEALGSDASSTTPDTTSENKVGTATQHTHKYSAKTISPTCESDGYTLHVCSCGHTYKDNYVKAIGHNWNAATCTSAKTCKSCGKVDGEPLPHNYINGICTYCHCYNYLYVSLAQDGFKYLEAQYGVTTYDVVSITGGEISGSPAVMLYYKSDAKYFTYNDVTGRITAWSIGNVEYTEYFRMDVKSILG